MNKRIAACFLMLSAGCLVFGQEWPAAADSDLAEGTLVAEAAPAPAPQPAPAPVAEKKAVEHHPAVEYTRPSQRIMRLGTHTSLGISGFNGHNKKDLGFFVSASAGLSALVKLPILEQIPVLNKLEFFPELKYSLYTASMEEEIGDDYFSEKEIMDVSLHALELPLLFRYPLPIGFPLFAEAGPQLGVILFSNTEHTVEYKEAPQDDEEIASGSTASLNRFMLALTAGIGYQVSERLSADLRVNYGTQVYANGTNGRPYSVMLGVNYLF